MLKVESYDGILSQKISENLIFHTSFDLDKFFQNAGADEISILEFQLMYVRIFFKTL